MATTDPYGQSISIAALTDPPNAQTLAQGIVDAVAGRLVLRFASATARTATLVGAAAPVPGMITYLATEDRYEARMSDGTWLTISPGPWIPLVFAGGFVAKTGSPSYRIVAGSVELRGTMEKNDATPFTKGAAFTIMTLPTAARPSSFRYFTCTTEFAAHLYARAEVEPGGAVNIIVPPSTGTGASWLSLDSVRFSLA